MTSTAAEEEDNVAVKTEEKKPMVIFPSMGDTTPIRKAPAKPRPKKFVCEHEGCTKAYSRPCLLEQHMRSHTNDRPFVCHVEGCHKAFLRDSHLKTHLLSHTDDKPLRCEYCLKGFNTNQHLNRHLRTHFETYKCDVEGCEAKFRKHTQLRKHKTECHNFFKKYRCTYEDCDKEFNHKSRLDAHIVKNHSPYPRYHCGEEGCNEKLYTWTLLQAHIKQCHKKTPCRVCGKPCSGPVGVAQHMKVHEEEHVSRRWQCLEPGCPETDEFENREAIINHYRVAHQFIPQNLQRPNEATLVPDDHQPPQQHTSATDAAVAAAAAAAVAGYPEHQPPPPPPHMMEEDTHEDANGHGGGGGRAVRRLTREPTMIERISGTGYADTGREIECIVQGCMYRFARQYDLRRHLASAHPDVDPITGQSLSQQDAETQVSAAKAIAAIESLNKQQRERNHPEGFTVVPDGVLNEEGELIDPMILNQSDNGNNQKVLMN